MKNIQIKPIVLLLISLAFPYFGFSQNRLINELGVEVKKIDPYVSITEGKLNEAHALVDLNRRYKPSWVREFISVEILSSHKGKIKKAVSKNDILTQEQKEIMKNADSGTDISVKIEYIPENTLKHNDPKEFDFTFTVDPEKEAKYPGGQQQLNRYLKENVIDKIPDSSFINYELTAIKFTIDEEGQITNAHVFESVYQSYENEQINELLLETIRKMPCWKPAEYSNGSKVKQEFALTVGNMNSCLMPLINVGGIPKD